MFSTINEEGKPPIYTFQEWCNDDLRGSFPMQDVNTPSESERYPLRLITDCEFSAR